MQSNTVNNSAITQAKTTKSGYIVNPLYDNFFFILAPLLSLAVGILISNTWFSNYAVDGTRLGGNSYAAICLGTFLMGHFVIGFFRAYGNPKIFSAYPYRFTVIPLLLYAGMLYWEPFLFICLVVTTIWDEWHSGQQTFGFCRIYDGIASNNSQTGRKLDMGINALIWFGPMLGGITLLDHVSDLGNDFLRLSDYYISDIFFNAVPAYTSANSSFITTAIIAIAIPFLAYYVYFYYRQSKNGYNVSIQKTALLVITAGVSLYTWGFNSFGEAYLIMNAFHYLQYYGLIWYLEKKNITRNLGLTEVRQGMLIAFTCFIALSFSLAYYLFSIELTTTMLAATFTIISMMHFWYDGFMFSVRKDEV